MIPKERISKLPQWAQAEIASLNREVERLQEHIACFNNERKTNTQVVRGGKHFLPNNSTVRFHLNKMFYIDVCVVDGEARIYGQGMINVKPRAANSIYIKDGYPIIKEAENESKSSEKNS
jgi:hypothetical protein